MNAKNHRYKLDTRSFCNEEKPQPKRKSFKKYNVNSRFDVLNRSYSARFICVFIVCFLNFTVCFTLSGCTSQTDILDAASDSTGRLNPLNNACSSNNETSAPGPVTTYLRASELEPEADSPALSGTTARPNPYPDLSVPTYLTKVDNTYFLVDCYHNQVICHDNLNDSLDQWTVMTDEIDRGHTLASDGEVYLIDDTERNRILILEKTNDIYVHTQTFSEIGDRPHYIIYDAATDTFYAWSSMSGEMYLFRHNPDDTRMYLTEIRRIESLDQVYVRSFTIIGNDVYFVSGNSSIIRADLDTFEILDTYPVPDNMAGMIQLTLIQDYFYITVSTDITGNQDYATILRTQDLSSLAEGNYEDIYNKFIGGGTPYYITEIDNTFYLTEHRLPGHSLWSFQIENNNIVDIQSVY